MESQEKQNRRLGKLESFVLALFGITLIVWILNKFANLSLLLTILITGLFISSFILLVSVLRSLLQKRQAKQKPKRKK